MTTREQLTLPRGVRIFEEPHRAKPFVCQWRVDGRRKTKFFSKMKPRDKWALGLAAAEKEIGVAAFRLNPDEAREWRAFKAEIGTETPLSAVRDCWLKYGKPRAALTVRDAVVKFTAAKTAEGIAQTTLDHYDPIFTKLNTKLGDFDVSAVTREQIDAWVAALPGAEFTRRSHQKLVRNFFGWLRRNRLITENPCEGLKPVRIVAKEVEIWTVDEVRSLFENNESQPPELLGRLALECFAGLRFSSASKVVGKDIRFAERGIVLPAENIKTRRRQFIDGLPDCLWFWLERSKPDTWTMTLKQYMFTKSQAVVRAGIRQVHNAARHSFGTYHVAAHKDASRTAAILCHTSPKMLYQHYKGRATEAEGLAYLLIYPTGASCQVPAKILELIDKAGK